jgi:hypothetical protein
VSPKSLALIAGGIAILAIAVYLFIEVRATPAQAGPDQVVASRTPQPTPAQPQSSDVVAKPNIHLSRPVPSTPTPIAPTPAPTLGTDPAPVREEPPEEQKANLKLDNLMEVANKAYDRQDFEEATAIAGKVLSKDPNNVRMLRIMVSANCIGGDSAIAQTHYERLPKFDREQMRTRCDRYGVTFKEPVKEPGT